MKRVFIGVVSALAVLAFAGSASAQDAKVQKGMKLYAEQKCTMCHAIDGKGNAKGPLDGVGTKLTAAEIKEWIVDPKTITERTKATRKPMMKAYNTLPAEDVDALVAYMVSLKKK